jgi:hypothetical protein
MTQRKVELLLLALILSLSLYLRLHDLDVYLSGDETKWICRGINFHAALARGELKGTYQSEHPGVLTMWITTLAVPLSQVGDWVGLCAWTGGNELIRVEDHTALAGLPPLIFEARQWLAVVTCLGLVGIWWLSRCIFGERTALLGTIFIALDPFYLALSRVLHLDALLTTFMSLSVLSLLVYVRSRPESRYLVLSALAAGLAIANKSPGLFLGPWTALLVLTFAWSAKRGQMCDGMCQALKAAVLWGLIALGVAVLLWPALWVDPVSALSQVFGQALNYADTPHWHSNFFWGQIRPDPGPAFYPVVWAFRTTPWVMLGLLLLLPRWRTQEKRSFLQPVTILGGFALIYATFMTLGAKKFDRYLLPVFPFVDLLAAIGWAELLRRWVPMAEARWQRWLSPLLTLALTMAQFAVLWPTRPYYFAYYNPLLGGARTAQRILLVGWGEGLEKAAAHLNAKPGAEDFDVSTEHISQFGPFFRGRSSFAKKLDVAHGDYYVLYVNTIQRWRTPEVLGWFYEREEPDHVISINGADYVWIYGNTALRGALAYVDSRASPATDCILLDVHSAATRQYAGPLPMITLDGSADEAAIVQALAKATEGRQRVWYITFPEAIGDVRGIIHQHLGIQADLVERASFPGTVVERFNLHSDAEFAPPIPTVRCDVRFGGYVHLLGYELSRDELSRVQPLAVTVYWQAMAPVETSYTSFSHLVGPDGEIWGQQDGIPLGGARPTTSWVPGEVIVDRYEIPLSVGAPVGDYTLAVGLYDLQTMKRLPAMDARDRRLPDDRILIDGLSLPSGEE